MSAPSPAFIVSDPPPLNAETFPYVIREFPAENLAVALVIPRVTSQTATGTKPNPLRFEP